MDQVQKKINSILVEKLGIPSSKITPDANFTKDLGIDSLDYAELVMQIEHVFDIKINDEDAQKIQTVNQVVQYVSSKKN